MTGVSFKHSTAMQLLYIHDWLYIGWTQHSFWGKTDDGLQLGKLAIHYQQKR